MAALSGRDLDGQDWAPCPVLPTESPSVHDAHMSANKRHLELHESWSGHDRVERGKHLQGARAPVDAGVASTRTTAADILTTS